MRVLFMGTGDIALPAFQALADSDFELVGLVTQPDKPVGRKQTLTPPKIKTEAEQRVIPIWQPERARSKRFLAELEALSLDLIVVMAYGQILSQRLIDLPSCAIINVHASLLPKYRGASCIQAPIKNGDRETGVTIMHVVKELDAGDIIQQWVTPISGDDTGGSVHDRLALTTPDVLLNTLSELARGTATRTPQDDERSCYAPKLMRSDGKINFSQSAQEIEQLIRAYDPWPGTYAEISDEKGTLKRMKIFPKVVVNKSSNGEPGTILAIDNDRICIACGHEDSVWLYEVQPEGKRRMSVQDYLRGMQLKVGDQF